MMPALVPVIPTNSRQNHKIRNFVYVAACVAALSMAASAQDQGAQSVVLSSGKSAKHPVHIVAKKTGTAKKGAVNASASAPTCYDSTGVNPGPCHFDYYGGPVISNPDVVVVYWTSAASTIPVNCGGGKDSHGNCIGVSQLLGALSNSTFVDMLQEYNTAGVFPTAGTGTQAGTQTIGRGTLHANSPFVITPSAANSGSPINDTQIQNEIQLQIDANKLPAPQSDSGGNVNTMYFVYFPPGLVISDPNIGTSCVTFCAYHSTHNPGLNEVPFLYGVIPDFGTGSGCDLPGACGSGTQFQDVSSASSHEYAEATTDAAVGLATVFGPPLGWYDVNNGEIGDMCNQNTDTLQFDSITYTFQQEFSQKAYNLDPNAGCVSPGALTFTLTAPASSSAGTAFDVTATVANSDSSKYLGTVHFTSSDTGATLPSDYTFTTADAGTHTFSSEVILHTSGSQTITAADAHQPSTAGTATVTVGGSTKTSTTTSLSSSVNPSTYNQQVTFTAVVTATSGAPTGTITFKDGASTLGTGTVSGGVASVMISNLAVGAHSITAAYGGDTNFNGSTSSVLSQVVNQAITSTALTSNPNPSSVNQTVTFTATVTGANGGTPTGTVAFQQGTNNTVGTGSLVSGVATFSVTYTTAGSASLTATYSGDTNYVSSTSALHTQVVNKAATTTALTSSNDPSTLGSAVTFTATVSSGSGTPAGGEIVKFMDGAKTLGSGALTSGVAMFTTSKLTVGTHTITATYAGDSGYSGSSSAVLTQIVKALPTTSSVVSSGSSSIYGQTVTFTANVVDPSSSGTPTGTVTFKSGTKTLGKGTLSGGTATLPTTALAVGTDSVTVTYNGSTKYAPSTSPAISQSVTKATSTTSINSLPNPSTSGQSVTFTVTVAPQYAGVPTGTVKLTMGTTVLKTLSLVNGKASYTTSTLPIGVDGITATYNGSANFAGSTSSISQTVNNPPAAPTGLVAAAGNGQVSLSWTASAGATSYNIRRSSTSGGPYITAGTAIGTSFVDTGLTSGATYYYVVTAVDAAGESPNSVQVSATLTPLAPTGLTASVNVSNGQVSLMWTASTGATSYNVKRSQTGGGPYTAVGTTAGTSFVDVGLTSGTTYYYVITAVNAGGESPSSVQVSVTIPPAAPTGLVAAAGNGQVSLAWTASAGATNYNIRRSSTSGGPYITAGTAIGTSFVDTGLTSGTTYYYVVTAVNAAGESANSAQVSATP